MFTKLNHKKWFSIYFFMFLDMFFIPIAIQAVDSLSYHQSEKTINAKETLAKGQAQWQKGELRKALLTLEKVVKLDLSNKQAAKVLKSMQFQKKKIDEYEKVKYIREKPTYIDNSPERIMVEISFAKMIHIGINSLYFENI